MGEKNTDGSQDKRSILSTTLVETPTTFYDFCLNPSGEEAPKNPLCPVCEEEIRPVSNESERRFVCGCETIWKFKFESEEK